MQWFKWATVLALIVLAAPSDAHSFKKGDIIVAHPWTRATPEGATAGVGYLKITNNGKDSDRLVGASFDGAKSVEIHEMTMEGDKMTMRQITDGIEIKSGETVELAPSKVHLMLLGLTKPIAEGANVNGSLTFKNAGTVDINFQVEPVGAMQSHDHKH